MNTKRITMVASITLMLILLPQNVFAMHIMEGFLPPVWCISWGVLCIPFVAYGLYAMRKITNESPKLKLLLAMAGAFVFVLSSLKIPSVTGSCSHPTGTGLGAILFGPAVMSVLGIIVLLFQSILLAHGGLTTLGANTFSMAIVGPFIAYGVFLLVKKLKGPEWLGVFLAAALGDLVTYIVTSLQLAVAFPAATGGIAVSAGKFMGIFAFTQVPLAISEGILTVIIFNAIKTYLKSDELHSLKVFAGGDLR
ncbi:energy-coupling factor ABC transporter permease [Dehalobacter sp. DCM]|uniref:energy-coupling factor ABC transporter permease n=1 Tax=Dehalobacter sp. DCM TaxID=2907827 RepID=UPI00308149E0|nr:energy-coupling factor ABC transporter permease [Dehalobacter sp. DCM]